MEYRTPDFRKVGAPRPRHQNDVVALQAVVRARFTAAMAEAKALKARNAVKLGAAVGLAVVVVNMLVALSSYAGGH